MMDIWKDQEPVTRKCQFCKQQRDCRQGPDPYLLSEFGEIEIVWLCDECYSLRQDGKHLARMEGEVPA